LASPARRCHQVARARLLIWSVRRSDDSRCEMALGLAARRVHLVEHSIRSSQSWWPIRRRFPQKSGSTPGPERASDWTDSLRS
jgi:hypothetical protein